MCQIRPPPFDETIAALEYDATVRWLVHQFKFGGRLACGQGLATCLARQVVTRCTSRPDLLIPVPLHPRRWRERGFNQADELARVLGRQLGLTLASHVVERVAVTREQSGLSARERRRNVRSAFEVREHLDGKSVVIVDDVMTTGSTVAALARVLRRAGAERVAVWTVARAPRPHAGEAKSLPVTATDSRSAYWLS